MPLAPPDALGECETRLALVERQLADARLFAQLVEDCAVATYAQSTHATEWLASYGKLRPMTCEHCAELERANGTLEEMLRIEREGTRILSELLDDGHGSPRFHAAKDAMKGLLSNPSVFKADGSVVLDIIIESAVLHADKLLAELVKVKP